MFFPGAFEMHNKMDSLSCMEVLIPELFELELGSARGIMCKSPAWIQDYYTTWACNFASSVRISLANVVYLFGRRNKRNLRLVIHEAK